MKGILKYSKLSTFLFLLIGVLFYGVAQTFVMHRMGFDWSISIKDALVSSGSLFFFGMDMIFIFLFYQPGKGNHFYRVLFVIVFTVLYGVLSRWFLTLVFSEDQTYLDFLKLSMPVRVLFGLVIFLFIATVMWLSHNLKEQREQEQRNIKAEQLAKEAELNMLRQKLQPHFLFNSLNSVSALAVSQPNEARKMIQQLSDFLRGTLKGDEQQLVSLKEELKHLNLYLEIEKVRFGHRLQVVFLTEEASEKLLLPSLLIQPIVENAIKFGLYGTLENTTISIGAKVENNYLVITVINPWDSQSDQGPKGTGFGLSSVQRRLFLMYARHDLLKTERKAEQFITQLKIPQNSSHA